MKITYLIAVFLLFVLLPRVCAEPEIDVVPLFYDFGEVEVGSSEAVVIVINNVGDSSIAVWDILFQGGSSGDYSMTSAPYLPVFFSAGGSVDAEITFTPSDNNPSSAVLEITSSDPNEPVIEVLLVGQGIGGEITPLEQIETILDFTGTAVQEETLVGKGPGKSAKNRLNALLNMLNRAKSLIEVELYDQACEQLNSAYKHADGQNRPPDFVTGQAAPELAGEIMELIVALECD
jgi:hypothetical protein